MVKIESSETKSTKSNQLNNLVTKADLSFPFNVQKEEKREEWVPETMAYEQGQNSGEESKEPDIINIKHRKEYESELKGKYIEKDASNSIASLNKSDISYHNSNEESLKAEEGEGEENQTELHKAHLIQTLQAIQYIRTLPNNYNLEGKYVEFPSHPLFEGAENHKTIIFDLDETLIHWVDEPETDNPHVILKVTFPNGETVDAGINIRPYAIEWLKVRLHKLLIIGSK